MSLSNPPKNPPQYSKGVQGRILAPICFVTGHINVPADKPGWFKIACGRCGLDVHRAWFRRTRSIPYKIERGFLWMANRMAKPRNSWKGAYFPVYRHIDQQIKGIGTEHSCGAYSYEGIMSLLKQYEDDGLPEPTLRSLVSEDGWINLEEHPEMIQPMLDDLNKGVELLRTKKEQEELNRYED